MSPWHQAAASRRAARYNMNGGKERPGHGEIKMPKGPLMSGVIVEAYAAGNFWAVAAEIVGEERRPMVIER